jgi:hypothetical protein
MAALWVHQSDSEWFWIDIHLIQPATCDQSNVNPLNITTNNETSPTNNLTATHDYPY